MHTEWNYTALADAYLERPDYSESAVFEMLDQMELPNDAPVCDVGAGVAHLTRLLARRSLLIDAVEPNDRMRELGQQQTASLPNVHWFEGTGEHTGRPDHHYALVTFGSSFNVTDRLKALAETRRILRPEGWFACMWNHRDLEDPIQKQLEAIIQQHVPDYRYGTRRESQMEFLQASGFFEAVYAREGQVVHRQSCADCVTAWRSHATLQRQAGAQFEAVIAAMETYLTQLNTSEIEIPYTTRIWYGRLRM